MTKSELRNAFIEIIKQKSYPNTIPGLVFEISLLCLKSGFITGEDIRRNFELERYEREKTAGKVFLDKYWIEISSVFWEFVANGTFALGYGPYPGEYDLSHFKITEYGKQWLTSEDKPIPEDYDGYLDYLRTNVENIDEVMFIYISEAINTFKNRNIFASAVMLGAAAEKMIYMLAEGIVKFPINRDLKNVILEALKYRRLKSLLDNTSEAIGFLINEEIIPYDVHEGSIHYLSTLFDAIRIQRNDAVHPIAGEVSKEQLRLLMLAFPHACKKVYDILEWLKENKNEE